MSDLIFCPKCEKGTSDAQDACEHCGVDMFNYWDERLAAKFREDCFARTGYYDFYIVMCDDCWATVWADNEQQAIEFISPKLKGKWAIGASTLTPAERSELIESMKKDKENNVCAVDPDLLAKYNKIRNEN